MKKCEKAKSPSAQTLENTFDLNPKLLRVIFLLTIKIKGLWSENLAAETLGDLKQSLCGINSKDLQNLGTLNLGTLNLGTLNVNMQR